MPRYFEWHHKHGDKNVPGWMIDEGRKLLGQLNERRKLGGDLSLTVEHKFADGSRVRASFYGNQPIVEYVVSPTTQAAFKGKPPLFDLYGPLFQPRDDSNPIGFSKIPSDLNGDYGMLLYPDGKAIKTAFYDSDYIPPGADQLDVQYRYKTGTDNTAIPQTRIYPGFQDGLIKIGQVDWTNLDGSLSVSYYGSPGRYGPCTATSIFYRGADIFRVSQTGDTGAYFLGACLRRDPTRKNVRYSGGIITNIDVFVIAVHANASLGVWKAQLAIAATPTDDFSQQFNVQNITRIGTQNFFVNNDPSFAFQPFFCNVSGTQAKCITPLHEYTIDIGTDAIAFSSVSNTVSTGSITSSTTTEHHFKPFGYYVNQPCIPGPGDCSFYADVDFNAFGPGNHGTAPSGFTPFDPTGEFQNSTSRGGGGTGSKKVWVDYVGDTAVYAYVETTQDAGYNNSTHTPTRTGLPSGVPATLTHDSSTSSGAASTLILPWVSVEFARQSSSSSQSTTLSYTEDVVGSGPSAYTRGIYTFTGSMTANAYDKAVGIVFADLRNNIVSYVISESTTATSGTGDDYLEYHDNGSVSFVDHHGSPSGSIVENDQTTLVLNYGGNEVTRAWPAISTTTSTGGIGTPIGAVNIGDYFPQSNFLRYAMPNGSTDFTVAYPGTSPTQDGETDLNNDELAGVYNPVTTSSSASMNQPTPPNWYFFDNRAAPPPPVQDGSYNFASPAYDWAAANEDAQMPPPVDPVFDYTYWQGGWMKVNGKYLISQPWPQSATTQTEYLNIFEHYDPIAAAGLTGAHKRYYPISYVPPYIGIFPR